MTGGKKDAEQKEDGRTRHKEKREEEDLYVDTQLAVRGGKSRVERSELRRE